MPNLVANRLVAEGAPAALTVLVAALENEDGELDFARHVPPPPEVEASPSPALRPADVADGTLPGWYAWRVEHWGTKWNAQDVHRIDGDGAHVEYRFNTAHSPPEPWLRAVSAAHAHLELVHEYCEEYVHVCGRDIWRAGERIDHEELDPEDLPWLDLLDDEDEDAPPEPEPPGEWLDEDVVVAVAEAVARVHRLQFRSTAGWAAELTMALGAVAAAQEDWTERLVEAAAVGLGAAAHHQFLMHGTGNVLDWRPILAEAAEDACHYDDRAPTGTDREDWQLALLDVLGSAAESMVVSERTRRGWEDRPESHEEARDWLVMFSATCTQAVAASGADAVQRLP